MKGAQNPPWSDCLAAAGRWTFRQRTAR